MAEIPQVNPLEQFEKAAEQWVRGQISPDKYSLAREAYIQQGIEHRPQGTPFAYRVPESTVTSLEELAKKENGNIATVLRDALGFEKYIEQVLDRGAQFLIERGGQVYSTGNFDVRKKAIPNESTRVVKGTFAGSTYEFVDGLAKKKGVSEEIIIEEAINRWLWFKQASAQGTKLIWQKGWKQKVVIPPATPQLLS